MEKFDIKDSELKRRIQKLIASRNGGHNEELVADIIENALKMLTDVEARGDARVIPSMWFSIELQATTPVPEWSGQPVRIAQEEDMIVGADGKTRWALKRQDRLFLVKSAR